MSAKGAGTTLRVTADRAWPLFNAAQTQMLERAAQATLPPHTLMQRAGEATARLARALAPHSQRIWVACGPGNNGGDGMEAALQLHRWGKSVHVSGLGPPASWPPDSQRAFQRLQDAGLTLHTHAPAQWDMAIDAVLGLGCTRPPEGQLETWLHALHAHPAPLLQVDLASGLQADTGVWLTRRPPRRAPLYTLSLLTLKPGLFTGDGRDASGEIWFNDLGVDPLTPPPTTAPMAMRQPAQVMPPARAHNSHKGDQGEVCVVGGAAGMSGAACLAAHAALRGGAGRVLLGLLDADVRASLAAQHPTLMVRDPLGLNWRNATVVCGCGGGEAIRTPMPAILSQAKALVLDADGLNALADPNLRALLRARHGRHRRTVLTPHPLEAARLLACTTHDVQQDRLRAATTLAQAFNSVVVLKGAGSVIADGQQPPIINASGCARLASAGTGDVLAGLIGARLAQGQSAWDAACQAVAHHGWVADQWPTDIAFDALGLTQRL